jgi:SAM-dependent methyltransferase
MTRRERSERNPAGSDRGSERARYPVTMRASEREPRSRPESDAVIWHDLECGSYTADLPLWEELADRAAGPVLELGAGTGRVALHLARRGHRLTAVESDPELAATLERRAAEQGLAARVEVGDVRRLALGRSFALVLAPMQLLQILGGARGRGACLTAIRSHLEHGGLAAAALVEDLPPPLEGPPPLPDVRDHGGWIYSSLPLGVERDGSTAIVRRLRQRVSPEGELNDEHEETRLEQIGLAEVEHEAAARGLRRLERRQIPATEAHVGSTALILEAL